MARPTVEALIEGVRANHRASLARAITLIESRNPRHQAEARQLLDAVMPHTGGAERIGLSGVPGVGKSTFIESLGVQLLAAGHRVAVLAVDPTSGRSGGSILGDKTRMERLSGDPRAFIRPSPSAGVLGGVARATQESILILEAAGFDVILVETVGTGQSETMVADMVDLFLVLMMPGTGDDLQGIKKGIIELADMIAVNKADVFRDRLSVAIRDYKAALHILTDASPNWHPPVMPVSGLTGEGLEDLWQTIKKHRRITTESGERTARRQRQRLSWMDRMLGDQLRARFEALPDMASRLAGVRAAVLAGELAPAAAVDQLLNAAFMPAG